MDDTSGVMPRIFVYESDLQYVVVIKQNSRCTMQNKEMHKTKTIQQPGRKLLWMCIMDLQYAAFENEKSPQIVD